MDFALPLSAVSMDNETRVCLMLEGIQSYKLQVREPNLIQRASQHSISR